MKRDMDLVRKILMKLENAHYNMSDIDLKIEGYNREEVSYHIMLLSEAGLIEARNNSSYSKSEWRPIRLTWEGHEFVEASRDEDRWIKAKQIIKERGGGVAFEVVKMILMNLMKESLPGS